MTLLLIAGSADDIFMVNMAKWLKHEIEIEIDVIALNHSSNAQIEDYSYYRNVDYIPQHYLFDSIPGLRRYTLDWYRSRQLKHLLRGRHYDIIHCHFICGMYAGAGFLKNYCDKLYFTFWGGERKNQKFLGSNKLYIKGIEYMIHNKIDGLVNGSVRTANTWKVNGHTPIIYRGSLGSASLERIYELVNHGKKNSCKNFYGIPTDKISVQICYSGKEIHQQLEIIDSLRMHPDLISKIHLVAPMTRGAKKEFVKHVEDALKRSQFTYTLLEGRFLSEDELAMLRCSVDVVLQLSTSDGYSRSIVELLCAGSVVIYGKWLKYQIKFNDDGFEGVEVSNIEEAIGIIYEYLLGSEYYNQMASKNIEAGKGKYLWSECIKDWVAVYKGSAKKIN